jgi:phage shock protein C
LGDYFSLDPILIRIIFILLFLCGGGGLLLYIILWIALPQEKYELFAAKNATTPEENSSKQQYPNTTISYIAGIAFIVCGILILLRRVWFISFRMIVPVCLILIGIILIISYLTKNKNTQP